MQPGAVGRRLEVGAKNEALFSGRVLLALV
jgi:hypothetical protein